MKFENVNIMIWCSRCQYYVCSVKIQWTAGKHSQYPYNNPLVPPKEKNQTIPPINKKVLQTIWASLEPPPPPFWQCPHLSSFFLCVCSLSLISISQLICSFKYETLPEFPFPFIIKSHKWPEPPLPPPHCKQNIKCHKMANHPTSLDVWHYICSAP